MITAKLGNDKILIVQSKWDSGTHLGFELSKSEWGSYEKESLDKVLTKEQIKGLELLLAATIKAMVKEGDKL